jgi:hypothetical protein
MELADYLPELAEEGVIGSCKTDQRFVKIALFPVRESVGGAFQYKTTDFVAYSLFHNRSSKGKDHIGNCES